MAITLGRLVGLGFFLFWIALTLFIATYPRDWTEVITTNPDQAAALFRAVFIAVMIWTGMVSSRKFGVIADDMVKLWAVWSTKKKKSE